jgi:DNA-binding transcriptional LysR family regulator
MGQPSASKHLPTLEAAAGEKLVERNPCANRRTEAGAIVAAHAVRVLDTLEVARESGAASRGRGPGTRHAASGGVGRRRPRHAQAIPNRSQPGH